MNHPTPYISVRVTVCLVGHSPYPGWTRFTVSEHIIPGQKTKKGTNESCDVNAITVRWSTCLKKTCNRSVQSHFIFLGVLIAGRLTVYFSKHTTAASDWEFGIKRTLHLKMGRTKLAHLAYYGSPRVGMLPSLLRRD